jgi:serine/threonine protein phosphatase PrpC/tetratricopeptide (TPR) repeat protein
VRVKLPDLNKKLETDSGLLISFQEEENIGKRKKEQQDAHGHLHIPANPALNRPAGYLFVVADGVSMGQAGALASKTAVEVILKDFQRQLDSGQTDLSQALADAFAAGNSEVYQLSRTRQGMATTCVAALVSGQSLITAHVGDSRIYLSRPGLGLMPVTIDHSWVAEMGQLMVQQGLMSSQELLRDSRRHTITRAFGLQDKIPADINSADLITGDLIVLCSDGLWDLIPEEMLDQATKDGRTNLPALSKKLVDAAMEAGGRDNITLTLVRVDQVDKPAEFPALGPMLERTGQEVAERTRPIVIDEERKTPSNFSQSNSKPAPVFSLPPRPEPRTTPPLRQAAAPADNSEVVPQIEDQPSIKLPSLNPEMLLAKAQKSFALGDWDKAIDYYIEIELIQASYHGLFESFSNSLIRYIGIAIGEGQVEQAENLVKHLEKNNINRYIEVLADYCNEESRRAATAHHYPASKAYAQFCMRLRPNDVRARNLSEMAELYLTLQKPRASLSERLAVAQKIYARDENYGQIQDDLAKIYMELGDEAAKSHALEDASGWYSMIMSLKPTDSRLLSLANNKHRSIKDDLGRRSPGSQNEPGRRSPSNQTTPPADPTGTPTPPGGASGPFKTLDRLQKDIKPEQELINRLKDRVSRAQKAWDGGRKEVGSEYIYLVDQLNDSLSPNPWQQTLPRVCYDYGKWLLEQRQYEEARPYFQKAQQLGMAAAQQRIKEVDRLIKEKNQGARGPSPLDLPDSLQTVTRPMFSPINNGNVSRTPNPVTPPAAPEPKESASPNVTNAASLFTPRRAEKISGPLIPPKPELPQDGIFMGKTRAPEGNFNLPSIDSLPTITNPSNPLTVQPRSAALIASGTWNRDSEDNLNPPIGQQGDITRSKPLTDISGSIKPALTSGGPRINANWQGDNIQQAARREISRAAGTTMPKDLPPPRRPGRPPGTDVNGGFGSVLANLVLPGLVIGVVVLALIIVWQLVMPKIGQNPPTGTSGPSAAATSTVSLTPQASRTATAPPLTGVQGIVRIEGVKPSEVVVFLATAGDVNSPYRELTQETTFFRLPVTTLNRLDPQQKYIIVVRPKDTGNRKYAENLSPDNPSQKSFISPDLNFDPVKGFDTTMRITTDMLAFYPLKGGDADAEQPGGIRYFAATRHSLGGDFLAFYNANGGLGRFGFPISEEFDWAGNGHVQFFERGWLTTEGAGKPVAIGKVSRTLLDSSCTSVIRLPANITPLALPTIKPDPDFAATADTLKLGAPQTQAFDVSTKLKVQYFDFGRLELNTTDSKAKPMLGLLGSEFARCSGWLK